MCDNDCIAKGDVLLSTMLCGVFYVVMDLSIDLSVSKLKFYKHA